MLQRSDYETYSKGCETVKKTLELEKQRHRSLLERRVELQVDEKEASEGLKAATTSQQKAAKAYEVCGGGRAAC